MSVEMEEALALLRELAGTVWSDAEYGPVLEIRVTDGVVEAYDFLGWLHTCLVRVR